MSNEIKEDNAKYLLLDDKGLVIEQNKDFTDNMLGELCDIILRGKKISNDNELLIAIQFEKNNIVISNDKNKKLSVCSLTGKTG